MASANATFTELVTTSLRNRSKVLHDNVSKHNALLSRLNQVGNIQRKGGGRTIVMELDYAENSTFQRYSGYDTLNISASDVLSAAEYEWKQAAVNVTSNGRELRINSGKEAMISLVKARVTNAMRTFKNNISQDIYSDGTTANQITGLAAQVANTGIGTVGGINSSTFTFWKNIVQDPASPLQGGGAITASASTIKSLMNPIWLELVRGGDKPDLIVSANNYFQFLWESLQDLQRYGNMDSKAVAGFSSLKFVTADVVHDGGTTATQSGGILDSTMYFLNTEFIKYVVHVDADMTMLDDHDSINQDAVVKPILWMGNLATSNRSLQGVIIP